MRMRLATILITYGLSGSARIHPRAGEEPRTEAHPLRGGPAPGDHRIRRPRRETGRTGAALRAAHRLQRPGADQRLRVDAQDGNRARSEVGGGSGAAHRGVPGNAHARRDHRQAENAAQTGRDGRVLSQDRIQGTVPGSGAHRRVLAAGLSGTAMLARRRRPLHHAAAGVFAQSRYRQAQLRHVPHAGLRRAHRRNALADSQTGRRTLSPHAAARDANAWTSP